MHTRARLRPLYDQRRALAATWQTFPMTVARLYTDVDARSHRLSDKMRSRLHLPRAPPPRSHLPRRSPRRTPHPALACPRRPLPPLHHARRILLRPRAPFRVPRHPPVNTLPKLDECTPADDVGLRGITLQLRRARMVHDLLMPGAVACRVLERPCPQRAHEQAVRTLEASKRLSPR